MRTRPGGMARLRCLRGFATGMSIAFDRIAGILAVVAPHAVLGLANKSSNEKASWTTRLKASLARTRGALGGGRGALLGRRKVDAALFEDLETALLTADCGVEATQALLDALRKRARKERIEDGAALKEALREALLELLAPLERPLELLPKQPFVIMVAGVNGSGKTTSIGKLTKWLQSQGKSVLLAAGDTFRASSCSPGASATASR
jgi:fused signal recognition particle receptor